MAINIKNPNAVAAIKELATTLGVSYSDAIQHAARVTLATSTRETRISRINTLVDQYQAHLPTGSALSTDDLYDNNGLFA